MFSRQQRETPMFHLPAFRHRIFNQPGCPIALFPCSGRLENPTAAVEMIRYEWQQWSKTRGSPRIVRTSHEQVFGHVMLKWKPLATSNSVVCVSVCVCVRVCVCVCVYSMVCAI